MLRTQIDPLHPVPTLSVDELHLTERAIIEGNGILYVNRKYEWSGGTLRGQGSLSITPAAIAEFKDEPGGIDRYLDRGTITNTGRINWTQGDIQVSNGATILNSGSGGVGIFDVKTDASITDDGTTATSVMITEDGGIVQKRVGGHTDIKMRPIFRTNGKLILKDGTLRFTGKLSSCKVESAAEAGG